MSGGQGPRRLWRHPFVFAAAAVIFASALAAVGGTLASFSAQTGDNTSTLAGGWVGAPTNLTVVPSGYNGQLAWSPGSHGVATQQLYGVDNGASPDCPASGAPSYTSLGTMASATTSTYTDSSTLLDSPRSNVDGHYVCYQMVSSHGSWTATGSFPATVLGLVPTGISYTGGGSLQTGTVITITYNQPVTTSSNSVYVCVSNTGQPIVILGNSSCAPTIGSFTGGTDSSKAITCTGSPVTVVGGTSIQVTLGGCGSGGGHTATMKGTTTFTGTGSVVTSSTGGAVQCTTSLCNPQMSW